MKVEIKYLALAACGNIVAPFLIVSIMAQRLETSVILPMAIIGLINYSISLLVFSQWLKNECVVFLTKDTIINTEE